MRSESVDYLRDGLFGIDAKMRKELEDRGLHQPRCRRATIDSGLFVDLYQPSLERTHHKAPIRLEGRRRPQEPILRPLSRWLPLPSVRFFPSFPIFPLCTRLAYRPEVFWEARHTSLPMLHPPFRQAGYKASRVSEGGQEVLGPSAGKEKGVAVHVPDCALDEHDG